MLAPAEPRCAGFAPGTQHDTCQRRGECLRFRSRASGPNGHPMYPFEWSACEGGDSFVHAESIAVQALAAHPAQPSSDRVLAVHPSTPTQG